MSHYQDSRLVGFVFQRIILNIADLACFFKQTMLFFDIKVDWNAHPPLSSDLGRSQVYLLFVGFLRSLRHEHPPPPKKTDQACIEIDDRVMLHRHAMVYSSSERKPCSKAPGNGNFLEFWNCLSCPWKQTTIREPSNPVTLPKPKALCLTSVPAWTVLILNSAFFTDFLDVGASGVGGTNAGR